MLKTTGLFLIIAGASQAATYTFEDANGEFIDNVYGGSAEISQRYQDELVRNRGDFDHCEAYDGPPDPYNENCEHLLTLFSDGRSDGQFDSFEEYYEAQFQAAANEFALREWRADALTIRTMSDDFFPYGPRFSFLGALTPTGSSSAPHGVSLMLTGEERAVSIDLSMGMRPYVPVASEAIVIEAGSITQFLPSGFQGTYFFGPELGDVETFSIWVNVSEYDGYRGLSYNNLVTQPLISAPAPPSSVPLPAPVALLGVSVMGLGALRLKRGRRDQNS